MRPCGVASLVLPLASSRAIVRVRSDSVSALVLVLKLKSRGAAAAIIAREIALEHVPGVANTISDALSRRFDPGKLCVIPSVLKDVEELKLPRRCKGYFRTLARRQPAAAEQVEQ